MNIQIHRAELDDYDEVAVKLKQLYVELGEEEDSVAYVDRELIEKMVVQGRTKIFKAIAGHGDIVGVLTLTESQAIYAGGAYGVIDELYVVPDSRSQNVGQQLVAEAVRIGREKRWLRLDVTAPSDENPRTVAFYKANGFVFTGPKLKLKY